MQVELVLMCKQPAQLVKHANFKILGGLEVLSQDAPFPT